eukprot:m51a1_g14001 hypothetical protein (176) ;mRNA; r:1065783-1067646
MHKLNIEEKKVSMSYLKLLLRVRVDDWDRILIKDLVWNNTKMPEANDKPRVITESPAPARHALPISDFLKEKGVHWERLTPKEHNIYLVAMVKEYQRAHGHAPPKREQWVDSASRMVNHYTDDNRPQFDLMLIIKPNFAFDSKGRPQNWGSALNKTRVPWWVPSVAVAAVFGLLI